MTSKLTFVLLIFALAFAAGQLKKNCDRRSPIQLRVVNLDRKGTSRAEIGGVFQVNGNTGKLHILVLKNKGRIIRRQKFSCRQLVGRNCPLPRGTYKARSMTVSVPRKFLKGRPTIQAELRERGKNRLIACAVVELDFGR